MIKRTFDILMSLIGLMVLSPVLVTVGLMVKLTSPGPIFFKHERMGRGFRPFFVYKFRSMVKDAHRLGGPVTAGEDPRITRIGRILRKTKLDEFPQLLNVLTGDMSLVGPRPECLLYAKMFRTDFEEILAIRPGVTCLDSLEYLDEETILAQADDPDREYAERILPEKIELAKEYIRRASFFFDLWLIFRTIFKLSSDRLSSTRPSERERPTE